MSRAKYDRIFTKGHTSDEFDAFAEEVNDLQKLIFDDLVET